MITNSNFASLKSADDTVDVSAEYLSSHRATSNDSIKSASTGAGGSQQAPSPKGGAAEWYYMATDNSQRGPVNSEVLSRLFDRGEVRSNTTIGAPPSELHAPTVRAVIDFLADKQRQLEITGAGVEERLAAYTAGLHELLPTHAGTAAWVRHPGQAL